MKTLVYTCNDLQHSLPCVDLLYNSLLKNNTSGSFDFAVVCNNRSHQKVDYNVLYDESCPPQYIGFLKYSSVISDEYDYYVYLDSDILFYDQLNTILPDGDKLVCVALEGKSSMIDSPQWHSFCYGDRIRSSGQNRNCINAGQFSFHKSSRILSLVRNNLATIPIHSFNSFNCAMSEQSSFNYTISQIWDCADTEKLTSRLSTSPETQNSSDKTIFHFAGFHEGMIHKHERMINFIQTHKKGSILI